MPRKTIARTRPSRTTRAAPATAGSAAGRATRIAAGDFSVEKFLTSIGAGRSGSSHRAKDVVFRQGDVADAVFYIQRGRIQLTVVSGHGKEGVVAILGPGDFFGEGCLAGQPVHMASASAMTAASVMRIEREAMVDALREHQPFSEMFMAFLLSRNIQIGADLVDHLFNSSEKRLARFLLLLADFGKVETLETVIPKISQEVLASRIGTTRSRINFFMNKFRKLGFIEYDGTLRVHSSLLRVVLQD
jgi:CRP/FNR family transcriptional regulator, cyclic AMP receptor protein